eukprot:15470285-Alexandrium_andersonii.AAC.1
MSPRTQAIGAMPSVAGRAQPLPMGHPGPPPQPANGSPPRSATPERVLLPAMVPVAGRTRGGNQPQRPEPGRAPHESKSKSKAQWGHRPQRK